jgi:hypothetical protein
MKALKIFEVQNFTRGIDPIEAFGGIGERLLKKFRLIPFIKKLSKYTKEYFEKNEMDIEDLEKDDEGYYGWQYYYNIGQIIGSFINSFYPYKERKNPDPEWGIWSLPTDPENDNLFHPAFANIINDWIKKEFPEDIEENQIWEGITDYMRYR